MNQDALGSKGQKGERRKEGFGHDKLAEEEKKGGRKFLQLLLLVAENSLPFLFLAPRWGQKEGEKVFLLSSERIPLVAFFILSFCFFMVLNYGCMGTE